MARQLRILYPGAWYHVMNRGTDHQPIFFKVKHRRLFTDILNKISDVYKIEVHAYCLMTNHYHILLRTLEPNLPDAMQYLDSVYTKRLNKDMSRDGPLLRGRFKSILVEQDEYLLHVSRYIHLNPLEANISNELINYPWSSYPYYVGENKKPSWLHIDFIRGYFQGDNFFKLYQNYTEEGNTRYIEEFYATERIKPILANEKFIARLKITKSVSQEVNVSEFLSIKVKLPIILDVVALTTGNSKNNITQSVRGQVNILRSLFIYLSRNIAGHKINDIAIFLSNGHYSAVSAALSRFEKKMIDSNELQSLVAVCKMKLVQISQSNRF